MDQNKSFPALNVCIFEILENHDFNCVLDDGIYSQSFCGFYSRYLKKRNINIFYI